MHLFTLSQYTSAGETDDARIARCLRDSAAESPRTIVFDVPCCTVSRAILLPPDTTVILDGCRIVQADTTVDNVFRGDNGIPDPADPLGMPLACGKTRNIRIIGRNGARISGSAHHAQAVSPAISKTQETAGELECWRTLAVCLSNRDGFEVSGIAFDRPLSFDRCINGRITDITLDTHGKNGVGIDLRSGCRRCVIRRIRGTSADAAVACTALAGSTAQDSPDGRLRYPMEPNTCVPAQTRAELDICDIAIEDICTNGCRYGVICRAANGCRVFDIRIDGVTESAPDGGHARESLVKVCAGGGEARADGDLHDISVRNVVASYAESAFYANTRLVRCTLQNIHHRNHGEAIRLDDPDGVEIIDGIPAQ